MVKKIKYKKHKLKNLEIVQLFNVKVENYCFTSKLTDIFNEQFELN